MQTTDNHNDTAHLKHVWAHRKFNTFPEQNPKRPNIVDFSGINTDPSIDVMETFKTHKKNNGTQSNQVRFNELSHRD